MLLKLILALFSSTIKDIIMLERSSRRSPAVVTTDPTEAVSVSGNQNDERTIVRRAGGRCQNGAAPTFAL